MVVREQPTQMRLLGVALLAIALWVWPNCPAAQAASEKRVALVVGVGRYQNVPALSNPANDAQLISAALQRLGFDVQTILDPDYNSMKRGLRDFGRKLDDAKIALFYYAGHGLQVAGRNYLIPTDAVLSTEPDLRYEAFDVDGVLDLMNAPGRVNLVFLDACRDNPFTRSLSSRMGGRSVTVGHGLAQANTQVSGTLIAYATAPDTEAADGTGSNSPFAAALARYIATPDLDVRQMLTRVRVDVQRSTGGKQSPWVHENLDADFYFVPPGTGPAAVASPVPPQGPAPSTGATSPEMLFWQSVSGSSAVGDYEAYLQQYPQGTFAGLARTRIAALNTRPMPPANVGEMAPPKPPTSGYPVGVGKSFRDCAGCPEMVVIPAGRFLMGSPPGEAGRSGDESPHEVTVRMPLAVGKYAVTFAEWDACVAAGGCSQRADDRGWGRGRRPVINVSWDDAQQYATWLSGKTRQRYRLLTEAEWEYAARGGTVTAYYTGSSITPSEANFSGSGLGRTQPVGSYPPNAFGLYDMAGNVWQWVQDCYVGDYPGAPSDASEAVQGGSCSWRVVRAGSWYYGPDNLRSASRGDNAPGARSNGLGFRLSRTPGG